MWIEFTWLMIGIIGAIMQMHSETLGFIKGRFRVTSNRNLLHLLKAKHLQLSLHIELCQIS